MTDGICPEDDYFHPRPDDPYWNESGWFPFHVPERELAGFVYMNHRPNMRFSMTGVGLWDPSGEEVYDSLYHDWLEFAPLTDDTEMFDFTTPNGLTLRCVEPLRVYRMTYDRDGCELDLSFTATMEPFDVGLPAGSEEWGSRHYEQGGRVTGTVRIHGEELRVDCGSNRDHSWGPRRRAENPRGDFPWFNDGRGSAFQMYTVPSVARDADPVVGTTERCLTGWIQRDGKESPLVEGSRRVVERRPDGVPRRLVVSGTDELGRTVEAEGRVVNVLKWPVFARYLQFSCLTEWTLESGQRHWGEEIEIWPGSQARAFLRSLSRP